MRDMDDLISKIAKLIYYLHIFIRGVIEIEKGEIVSMEEFIKELEERMKVM